MIKKLLLVIGCVIVGVALYMKLLPASAHSGDHQVRIALFVPISHPALEEVERGFKETMDTQYTAPYRYTCFNAQGNKSLLRAQAEEIIAGNYDLVVTLGATCSETIVGLIKKKGVSLPHVFCAVDSKAFAKTLCSSGCSTGVYVELDYIKEMDLLHKIKPEATTVLLVYDPTHGTGLEKYKHELASYLKRYSMTLNAVEIYHPNEIQYKVSALLPKNDVVLVLVDNTVVAGIDALISLCNRYGITLMASDLASGKKGAALAYGIEEYESGKEAAIQSLEILSQGKSPKDIAICAVNRFTLAVNAKTAPSQSIDITSLMAQPLDVVIIEDEHHD